MVKGVPEGSCYWLETCICGDSVTAVLPGKAFTAPATGEVFPRRQ